MVSLITIGLRLTDREKRVINNELVKDHFQVQDLEILLKRLKRSKKNLEKNHIQVNLINNGLRDLREIENMSEEETIIEGTNKIVYIVENILKFNKQKQQQQQQGQGLKILTPNQMLRRLPISLAQLKAENNSEKLKNEIRQLLYSLYRSKKLTKQLYKSLIDII